ncbi:DUF2971 domain-containing protein [Pseudomonas putida]|uniref:DUF2971 domain-containing protein n=1 Tax=Pseudomonas putida TaxID=303 RepID=UPI003FD58F30
MLVYNFVDDHYGLINLKKRRLKVSQFDSVNDPFELLCHSLGDRELRRRMGKFKKSTASGTGMICFSRSMSSPVQWAHYANRHKGLCLGFEVPERFLEPVRYVSERIDFRPGTPWTTDGADPRAEECFLTKYEHWSYEQELRLFGDLKEPDPESGLYFNAFSEHMKLVEVYVGCASDIMQNDLYSALGDLRSEVQCFKVRPAFNSFNMVRNKAEQWN